MRFVVTFNNITNNNAYYSYINYHDMRHLSARTPNEGTIITPAP